MNKIKLAVIVAMVGLASPVHAAMSERCQSILEDSARTFASIDAIRDGYSPENMPDEDAATAYMEAEAEAMVAIYGEGAKTVSRGATRVQAQKFIRDSNSRVKSDLPPDVTKIAHDASEAAFMCGYDDQTKDM